MKTSLLSLVCSATLTALLAGCGDSSTKHSDASTNAATRTDVTTAPVDYLKSVVDARHSAVKTVDVASLKKAIDMFNVQEGRFPKDLNELVARKYMPEIPSPPAGSRIEYEASAGTVKLVQH